MKFSLVAIAATLAVASAADCDLTKITPLLTDSNVSTCTSDSGFSFTSAATPTAEVAAKICASTACLNVLAAVKALGLGDCTLLGLQLETDLITPIETACGSTTASSGSSAGSSATATVGSTAGSSAAVTASSSATATSSGSAEDTTVETPTATTTPTPTTASASSSVNMAASAAIVAVAAAFL